ncbi:MULTISPECIES: ABC transporter substrate-binding protein [unclassified Crossiella]|uniref:ABC transporter substrate-binding protein n=1 Tax=unclassified Crossiella TaxID=2620835 RepID=UPI001FFE8E35|nr:MULTISPECIES: ABC transporter substrate-binding protein [unclassified Crossiella]MCK2238500.1 ABC transporter substrate-binding protein [Crossiella sp. S99.2]MCK2251930.1 ABC transporter substrate-binding protein [Crossiella sp. S99.1]
MRVKRIAALTLTGILALGLVACGTGNSGAGGNPGAVLNIGAPNGPQPENHNPFLETSAAGSLGYRWMIYEPLGMRNKVRPTDPSKPWLASKWEWADNFTKLTLTVRDNVKFSDGKPMTAEDVAFSLGLLKKNPAFNLHAIPFGDITPSGNTVTVTFPRSQYTNQVMILEAAVVPKHIWEQVKDPSQELNKNPVGTGPYTLKSFTQQTVTLTARDSYWQELPKVKELRYTSYNDNNAQTTALASGASEWAFVFIPNYKAVYTSKNPQHHKLWFPASLGIHGLWFNTEKAPFDNAALRRAINLVINREDIFTQAEAGYFYPKVDNVTGIPTPNGDSFIAPEHKGKTLIPNVTEAKKLVTDAGFRYDGNTLLDPAGKPVKLTMSVPSGWSDYVTTLEIIKDNLSGLGVTATVDKTNQDAWTEAVEAGNFDAVMHWTEDGPTPYQAYRYMMDSELYKPLGTGQTIGNYGRFRNAEATAALRQYANASDDAARAAALNTVQRIMIEQQPVAVTGAANLGGMYSTKNWVGWPEDSNPYAPAQPSLRTSLDVVLHLKPAS